MGSSLILSLGSLDLWGVRWICPGFVGSMGCSLDYRFLIQRSDYLRQLRKEVPAESHRNRRCMDLLYLQPQGEISLRIQADS